MVSNFRMSIFLLVFAVGVPSVFGDSIGKTNQPVHRGAAMQAIRDSAYRPDGRADDPPAGSVRAYAEWEPASGVIISWKWFDDYFTDLTEAIVQAGTCWIVVDDAGAQSDVTATLTAAGVSMENVEFLTIQTDTVWIVDYGPCFIAVDGMREIIDHYYGWTEDNLFPQRLGMEWSIPYYTTDLTAEGGNFISDGMGNCFITSKVFENNPGMTPEQVMTVYRNYCGCDNIYVLDYLDDYTGHIDMFAMLLDVDTMMIGQYEPGDPEYQLLEDNAAYVESLFSSIGTPYEVIRVPMPGDPAEYRTYTNSLMVNDAVLVPLYNLPDDAGALTTIGEALPDHTVLGVDSTEPIAWGGAIHCTTKVVPIQDVTPAPTTTVTPTPSATATMPPHTSTPTPTPGMTVTPEPTFTSTNTPSPVETETPAATSTPPQTVTATMPPVPSRTPTSTSTPVNPPSPTSTSTSTPLNTSTPTSAPEPTFTPTPKECTETGVTIRMPAKSFKEGDICWCKADVCNAAAQPLAGYPLFVILDVFGSLFFAPGFTGEFDNYLEENPVFPGGITEVVVLPEFTWPDNVGSAAGIVFYGALTNPEMTAIVGRFDSFEFGWGE